ncbi:hypothetical protein N307_07657, partial [Dryobates pubescens]
GWDCRDVVCAHSRAHSANHCSQRALCSSVSGLPAASCASPSPPPSAASWLCSSCFCIIFSFSSWMVSSSWCRTCWGTQLLSMEVRKGSGAQTSMSSVLVGMRR